MNKQSSRLTKKFQTTIPQAIRKELGLVSGDIIHFELRDGEAVFRKETPLDLAYLQALDGQLAEWLSEADEEAYGAL